MKNRIFEYLKSEDEDIYLLGLKLANEQLTHDEIQEIRILFSDTVYLEVVNYNNVMGIFKNES